MPERSGYQKAVVILCIVFGVSLGLCGLTVAASSMISRDQNALIPFSIVGSLGMIGSLVGLVLTGMIWLARRATRSRVHSDPQKLFEDDRDDHG